MRVHSQNTQLEKLFTKTSEKVLPWIEISATKITITAFISKTKFL